MTETPTHTGLRYRARLTTLTIRRWGASATDRSLGDAAADSAGAEAARVSATKRLLGVDALKGINAVYSAAHERWKGMTVPFSDTTGRMIASAKLGEFVEVMERHQESFGEAVNGFLGRYEEEVDAARRALGSAFNPDNYPSARALQRKFNFNWSVSAMPVLPDDLRDTLSPEIAARIEHNASARYASAADAAVRDVLARIQNACEHVTRVLGADSPRIVTGFSDKLADLAAVLPSLNVTGDPKLKKVIDTFRLRLDDLDDDRLRDKRSNARQIAMAQAKAVMSDLSDLI